VENTRRDIQALESERSRVSAAVAEDAVQALLTDDAGASPRILAGKGRSAEIDQELAERRERLTVQEEAARRVGAQAE
jgi:hypothetical protein